MGRNNLRLLSLFQGRVILQKKSIDDMHDNAKVRDESAVRMVLFLYWYKLLIVVYNNNILIIYIAQ